MLTTPRGVLASVEEALEELEAALQGAPSSTGARTLRGLQVAEEMRDALLPRGAVLDADALTRAREAALALSEEVIVQPEVGPLTRLARGQWRVESELSAEDEQLRLVRMRLQDATAALRTRWHAPRGEAACLWSALAELATPDVRLWEVVAKALRASTPSLPELLGRLGRSFELELVLEESWPALTGTLLVEGALQPILPRGGPQSARHADPRTQARARARELEARFEMIEEDVEGGLPRLLEPHASPYQSELLTDALSPLLAQLVRSRLQEVYTHAVEEGREREYEIVLGSSHRPLARTLEHDPLTKAFAPTPLREGERPHALYLRAPRLWAELIQRRQLQHQLLGGPVAASVAVTPTPDWLSGEVAELASSLWRESENAASLPHILAAARDCLR